MGHGFRRMVFAAFVCIAAAFLFIQPIFSQMQNLGLYDWDQHFFYHASPRISLLTFGEIPLWTPYYCGGNVLIANPQLPFLSPFFLLVLLFGAVVGLKLEALIYLAAGLFGAFLAARKLGSTVMASAFAAIVFMFSTWFVMRVVVGHTTFFPFALLPLVFLFYLKSAGADADLRSRIRWGVAAALVLAVMLLSGGIYPFYSAVIMVALYSVLDFASARKLGPLAAAAAILAVALLLSAVKVLPVADFASGVASEKDVQLTSAGIVFRSLLSREQSIPQKDVETGRDLVPEGKQKDLDTLSGKLPWGWHEYSAYVGIIPFLLAAAAALFAFRRSWKLVVAALFFLALALGSLLPAGPWGILRQLPFFSSLHGPSRFIIVFVFFIALLAARALSSVKILANAKIQRAVVAVFLIVVAADLALVSRPLLSTAFPLAPLPVKSTELGSPEFIQMFSTAPKLAQYTNLLQGIGTLNCYERLHLKIRAIPQFVDGVPYGGFIGNAYLAETNESVNFTHFSPNRMSLNLPEMKSESTLVVNQNYYKGWKAGIGGRGADALSFSGLIAVKVSPSDSGKEVEFKFTSPPFAVGAVISVLALVAAIFALFKPAVAAAAISPVAAMLKRLEALIFRQQ